MEGPGGLPPAVSSQLASSGHALLAEPLALASGDPALPALSGRPSHLPLLSKAFTER